MGKLILKDVGIFLDDKRINSSANAVALEYGADAPEGTCFGDTTHKMLPGGLRTASMSAQGYFEADDPDKTMFEAMGVAGSLISLAPDGAVGGVAYMLPAVVGEYTPFEGGVGDPAEFSLNAGAYNDLLRGVLGQDGSVTISGNGLGYNQGAVLAGQKVYAGLHVFSSAGDGSQTLDVVVESDSDDLWTTPVDRLTFAQLTSLPGVELLELGGPITDTWWRVKWTVGGTGTPSFDFAVIIAIL